LIIWSKQNKTKQKRAKQISPSVDDAINLLLD
jgi:hypothetical protein